MARYILGIHSGHDSSACLLKDDEIFLAIEKERLTRKKHDSGEPKECVEYLLNAAKISPRDINLVVRNNWFDSTELDDDYYKKFPRVIVNKNHQLFHAYAVSVLVPQNMSALIWIVDGRGCRPQDCGNSSEGKNLFEAESVYRLEKGHIIELEKRFAEHRPKAFKWGSHIDMIGYAYSAVSKTIFRDYNAAGKVMALASFGQEDFKIPRVLQGGDKLISEDWLNYVDCLELSPDWRSDVAKNLSYAIQNALEIYSESRVKNLVEKYRCKNICLSGGVALNCKNNGRLANLPDVENLFLFPASGDNGLSIGAAIWAARKIFDDYSPIKFKYALGKNYGQIENSPRDIEKVVKLLIGGEVVGIFENGSEFGPRALCNRSLTAAATNLEMKNILNAKIKRREEFRPFGGIILEKNLSRITDEKVASDYMLSAIHVKKNFLREYPALCHEDGTIRIQILRDENLSAYKILDAYERRTGKFLLINTSFNAKNEPIVETPQEALTCAKNIGVKYILCNGLLIK